MNKYIIQLIDGSKITITETEYQKLAGRTGLVFIPSLRETINMLSISRIYPVENSPEEKNHTMGVLHDGTKVIRQFGQWFCLTGERDEKGHYETRPDPNYYLEVACDTVPSVKDYEQKFAHLEKEERKKLMIGGRDLKRYLQKGGLEDISSILNKLNE